MYNIEWKVHVHREEIFSALKKHRLLDGSEGEQKQGVEIFEED